MRNPTLLPTTGLPLLFWGIDGPKQKKPQNQADFEVFLFIFPDQPVVSGDTTPTVKGQVHTVNAMAKKLIDCV